MTWYIFYFHSHDVEWNSTVVQAYKRTISIFKPMKRSQFCSDSNFATLSILTIWTLCMLERWIKFYYLGCPKLSAPVNGNYHCTRDREYSSSCVFTCDKNFVLVVSICSVLSYLRIAFTHHGKHLLQGSENIVCQKDEGVWKPEIPPYCTCPSCWSGSDCSFSLMWSVAVSQLNSSFDFNDLQVKAFHYSY